MNKKALSLLLAVSMVFSMNTVSFAGTKTNDAVVAVEETSSSNSKNEKVSDNAAQSTNAQSGNSFFYDEVSANMGGHQMTISYNSTSISFGKKLNASQLNIQVSINGVSKVLKATKIKAIKADKKKSSGEVYFGITKLVPVSGKLTKDEKKIVKDVVKAYKAAIKAADKTKLLKVTLNKFSVSYNNVTVTGEKKVSSLSDNNSYALSVFVKKGKVKVVKVFFKDVKKGKVKSVKVKKSNYTFSNGELKFTGSDFEGTVIVKDSKVSKPAVSGNSTSANAAK